MNPKQIRFLPLFYVATVWLATACSLVAAPPAGKSDPAGDFARRGVPFLEKHCVACHSTAKKRADLDLEIYQSAASVLKDRQSWENVLKRVQSGEMPPSNRPRPTLAETESLKQTVTALFDQADRSSLHDPGHVTIRRLNRTEYNNTIRDLVGIAFQPAEDFPSDDVGHGFDNIGDVLSLSPLLLERYLAAAETIVQRAVASSAGKPGVSLMACTPGRPRREQAREILSRFASRAYRRPSDPAEVERLLQLVDAAQARGETWEAGVHLALQAVLVSPRFLFRVELDDRPDSTKPHPIDEYQLASRLSYFLWSSMPDQTLFDLAAARSLTSHLEEQVRRLLRDPKATALVENFALQWLQLRPLKTAAPDRKLFPQFDERLRSAMRRETELFFEAIVREDRSILDLIDADFTFLNERLARHYGIVDTAGNRVGRKPVGAGQPIRGERFQRVALHDGERGGLLTQASILTVTSNPTRTSPVKRGRWILEQILGTPPPPPPPNVPALPDNRKAQLSGSLRQRMEQHRADPACANCHARMDPIGFAFEHFDAIGAFRTRDGSFLIDPSGTLPDGRSFQGPAELKRILKDRKDLFSRCLTEKMLTYALGRGLESHDRPTMDAITAALARNDYRFSTLVIEIVKSDPFRLRRAKEQHP